MNLLASIGVKNVKMYKALGFDVSTTAKLHICEILILQLFLDNKTQGTLPGASPFAAVNSTHS